MDIRPDGFMLYGKLGVNFFSTTDMVYLNTKVRLQLIRARPSYYQISDNPSVTHGTVNFFTHVILLSTVIITRNEWTCWNIFQWSTTTWKLYQRISSFLQDRTSSSKKNIFNNAPVHRIYFAMNRKSEFTGWYTESPFWCQLFKLKQNRIFVGG